MPSAETQQDVKTPSKAGIVESADGERRIPASTRADGSVRKEIRVRPGYRPPEDVEVYRNRTAQAWKNRGKGGVPGATYADPPPPKKPIESKSTANRDPTPKSNGVKDKETKPEEIQKDAEPVEPEVERQREARKLSKKLRQARELQQKKDSGNDLLPEQFQKVIQINELMRQLEKLGFDNEGKTKDNEEEESAQTNTTAN